MELDYLGIMKQWEQRLRLAGLWTGDDTATMEKLEDLLRAEGAKKRNPPGPTISEEKGPPPSADPCPECKGTQLVILEPGGTPQRCMACYVHEEDMGVSDFMVDPDWNSVTINGAKAGFTLARGQANTVQVTVRRFG